MATITTGLLGAALVTSAIAVPVAPAGAQDLRPMLTCPAVSAPWSLRGAGAWSGSPDDDSSGLGFTCHYIKDEFGLDPQNTYITVNYLPASSPVETLWFGCQNGSPTAGKINLVGSGNWSYATVSGSSTVMPTAADVARTLLGAVETAAKTCDSEAPAGDTEAPQVIALDSGLSPQGRRIVMLRFMAYDDSGEARADLQIYRVRPGPAKLLDSGSVGYGQATGLTMEREVRWVLSARGVRKVRTVWKRWRFAFCVDAYDRAGNSGSDCARLDLRKPVEPS